MRVIMLTTEEAAKLKILQDRAATSYAKYREAEELHRATRDDLDLFVAQLGEAYKLEGFNMSRDGLFIAGWMKG